MEKKKKGCIERMGGEEVKSNGEEGGRPNSQEEKILVSVRLRPLNERELARNDGSDWECISENTIMIKNSIVPTAYTFGKQKKKVCLVKVFLCSLLTLLLFSCFFLLVGER